MIWTVIQTSWRRLKNNRSEWMLTFLVPILFFSIFAVIFGSRGSSGSGTPKIAIAIADESGTPIALRAAEILSETQSLRITERSSGSSQRGNASPAMPFSETLNASSPTTRWDRRSAEDLVRRGMVSAAIVFQVPASESADPLTPTIEVLSDAYDQVASQVVSAMVQRAILTAMGEHQRALAELQASEFASARDLASARGTGVVPASAQSLAAATPSGGATTATYVDTQRLVGMSASSSPVRPHLEPPAIAVVDVLGGKKTNPVIAMYAAGIAVMFLLFSATTASGSLLEERENSTLDRLLASRLTMDQLLLGKWAYLTGIGILQMTLMFVWGSWVFGIALARHWEGFAAMTLVTAGASASFALFLASLCRSRSQLGWVSTIVILTMSALGGSMVPRYLMSETIQKAGLITFNAWALEGYNKIFWRELSLRDIELELGVLTLCGLTFILLARCFVVRWERS